MHFPRLKTSAIMQYGGHKSSSYANRVLRFMDGSEQRFRTLGFPERRWWVVLTQLDEGELAGLEAFFEALQGQTQEFVFEDPDSGIEHQRCRLGSDVIALKQSGLHQGEAILEIVEVRT